MGTVLPMKVAHCHRLSLSHRALIWPGDLLTLHCSHPFVDAIFLAWVDPSVTLFATPLFADADIPIKFHTELDALPCRK